MAVYRETPKCPYCGEVTATAVHKKTDGNFIGDTFLYWDYKKHSCKGSRQAAKKNKKDMNIIMGKIVADAKEKGEKLPPFFKIK